MRPVDRSINFTGKSRLPDHFQRGQGTVEFILILVVTVSLVLLVSTQFYKPMGQFVESYMGDYLGCLLDRGVLPKLGAEDDECSSELSLPKGSSGKSPTVGGGPSDSERNNPEKKNKSETQEEMSNSRKGGSSGAKGTINASRRSPPQSMGSDGTSTSAKTSEEPDSLAKSKYYKVTNARDYNQGSVVRKFSYDELPMVERERIKKRENRVSRVLDVASDLETGKPKILRLKPPERKLAEEAAETPWSFGKIFRIALIIIIIIAIVIFLSGQILQISKSWEK